MAIDSIENNELPALSPLNAGAMIPPIYIITEDVFSNVTGAVAKPVNKCVEFQKKWVQIFNDIKGDASARNDAKAILLSANGCNVIEETVNKHGGPDSQESLRQFVAYASVIKAFPVTSDNCEVLQNTLTAIEIEIENANKNVTAGTTGRVMERWLKAYNARRTELQKKIEQLNCVQLKEIADQQKAQDDLNLVLSKAGEPLNTSSDKINNYILYGVFGVMAIAGIYVIFKGKSAA